MITSVSPPATSPTDPISAAFAQPQSSNGTDSSFEAMLSEEAQPQGQTTETASKTKSNPSKTKDTSSETLAEAAPQASLQQNVDAASAALIPPTITPVPVPTPAIPGDTALLPDASIVEVASEASAPTAPSIIADPTLAAQPAAQPMPVAAESSSTTTAPHIADTTAAKPAENAGDTKVDETEGAVQTANGDPAAQKTIVMAASTSVPAPDNIAAAASLVSTVQPDIRNAIGRNIPGVNAASTNKSNANETDGGTPNTEIVAQNAHSDAAKPAHRGSFSQLLNQDASNNTQQADAGTANASAQTGPNKAPVPAAEHIAPAPQTQAAASATNQTPSNLGSLIAQTNVAPPSQTEAPVRIAVTPGAQPDLEALAVRIARRSEAGESQFAIRLDPPALGRIDVKLHVDTQGNAQAQLSADRPQTLHLLQRDAAVLERALKDAGLDLGNGLSFSLNGEHRQTQERTSDQGRGRYTRIAAVDAPEIANPVLARWSGQILGDTTRVDITV